jgi:hypothetical protein
MMVAFVARYSLLRYPNLFHLYKSVNYRRYTHYITLLSVETKKFDLQKPTLSP